MKFRWGQILKFPAQRFYLPTSSITASTKRAGMDDFLKSKIAGSKNGEFLRADRWFNHKDLKELLPHLKKIGKVKFAPFKLGELSPAKELEDFYNKITADPKIWGFRLIDPGGSFCSSLVQAR